MRKAEHQNRLPRAAVESPFVVILKPHLDVVLCNPPAQQGWTRWSPEAPSDLNHLVILLP